MGSRPSCSGMRVRLVGVLTLALSDAGVQEVYAMLNPEKLAYLQRQLSARQN